jgi:predicted anti-sigma-YlaC factor YlaD
MSCPDINRFIDVIKKDRSDPEVEAHLEECPECRADFEIVKELSVALRPEVEVSEALIERVMASLPFPEVEPEARPVPAAHLFLSGVLGIATTLAVLMGTGAGSSGGPTDMLLFSMLGGVAVVVVQARRGRRPSLAGPGSA